MNELQINNLWSWILQQYKIECEERKGEIIAAAKQLFQELPIEKRQIDLFPQATILSCLLAANLFCLKVSDFPPIRRAARELIIDPRSILGRISFLNKYCSQRIELEYEGNTFRRHV